MTRVFFSQKTEQLIKKLEITQIRNNFQENINQNYQLFGETNFKVLFTWIVK